MSGSGGGFRRSKVEDMKNWIRPIVDQTAAATHNSDVSATLNDLLAEYNDRDTQLVGDRLDEIKSVLQDDTETTFDLRFGGSVHKHTYVDGLSDIDALMLLRDPALMDMSPKDVIEGFLEILLERLPANLDISVGPMAVTIEYPDKMKIQILPAIASGTGIKISTRDGIEWSGIIRPEAFAGKLTDINQENGGKIVPTIKLVKGVIGELPDRYRLTGYHVESLALEAFKSYDGPKNTKDMLHHFFDQASNLVRRPIKDSTGQSLNVDEYLGSQDSPNRMLISGTFSRIARSMRNADDAASTSRWLSSIGE